MSGFENPPPTAPTAEKGAGYCFASMSGMLDLSRAETATCPVKRHGMIENRGFLDHRGAAFRP